MVDREVLGKCRAGESDGRRQLRENGREVQGNGQGRIDAYGKGKAGQKVQRETKSKSEGRG